MPHQPGRFRDKIPLPDPLRPTRTSPVGSLGHRRNLRDSRAKQGTTRGIEHQVKIDQFQAFISRLSMEKGVLDLQELHAVSSPVKTPSSRSAVELSKEDLVSDALPRENLVPRWG